MALDFTVIASVRQRFGDSQDDDLGLEKDAPFVGQQKDFPFACPGVDASQSALLLFQSQGVTIAQKMNINGQVVFGGIPTSVDFGSLPTADPNNPNICVLIAQWKGNVMLVQPGVLRDSNNVLRITADKIGDSDNVDNFIIYNVVVIFKLRTRQVVDVGSSR